MDGWTIGLLIGGVGIVLVLALMAVVMLVASKTARNAQAVLVALEDVRAKIEAASSLDQVAGAVPGDGAANRPAPGDRPEGEPPEQGRRR